MASTPDEIARRLIAYGSLVPDASNHREVAMLDGTWTEGWITGTLTRIADGEAAGYFALEYRPDGERIPAWLLESDDLVAAWSRLDEFEGEDYERIVIPFHTTSGAAPIEAQVYVGRARSK